MPARIVDLHRLAREDFRKAVDWYSRQNPAKALEFIAAVRNAQQDIGDHAELYGVESHGVRWLLLRKFPYIIRFTIISDSACQIVAISHKSRRPGHWARRLSRP
ncbi:MAG TPA: type II toxin-antitoxin system RelE/ParE family toxin [Gemmataceae bacterium]|jgi:plasmid stabilization system protein ParE|nr:type II toxin-antitoxin system RelE/ParE family toxin [Gemmataceae bacterium]